MYRRFTDSGSVSDRRGCHPGAAKHCAAAAARPGHGCARGPPSFLPPPAAATFGRCTITLPHARSLLTSLPPCAVLTGQAPGANTPEAAQAARNLRQALGLDSEGEDLDGNLSDLTVRGPGDPGVGGCAPMRVPTCHAYGPGYRHGNGHCGRG